jgi:hypothetical protein
VAKVCQFGSVFGGGGFCGEFGEYGSGGGLGA